MQVLRFSQWRDGRHTPEEIGRHFGVGYTSIVNAHQRGARFLSADRSFGIPAQQAIHK